MEASGLVTIVGGSGFVGRYVVRELAERGWRIRVASRNPERAYYLQPLGSVGQIQTVQCNIRDAACMRKVIEGSDAVVNLVGILAQGGKQSFERVHLEGARHVAEAAKMAGVERLVHVSAIGADVDAKASYASTKGQAEACVLRIMPDAVILRPSIIFGEEDNFFNQFAAMRQLSPFLPAIGCGRTMFQPVYVADVAKAVGVALAGGAQGGAVYELGGPKVYTFAELLRMTQQYVGRKPRNFPIPYWLASIQGFVLQMLPGKLLTLDQVRMLKADNVVSDTAIKQERTLAGLGIDAHNVEDVVPIYLERFKKKGMFNHYQHMEEK